jgi:hypothetical protein
MVGAIFRYYLYNPFQPALTTAQQTLLYQKKQQNPIPVQFVATIAPLFANETITTGPVGRLLTASSQSIPTPAGDSNNSVITPNPGFIALAPAVLQQDETRISVDFIGTFPDNFQQPPSGRPTNDKWDFGPVNLVVAGNGTSVTIGPVDYTDTAGGNAAGWLFDFDISGNAQAQELLSDPTRATFSLQSENAQLGTVLAENDYFFVTNQLAIYAEQGGAGDSFLNQGTSEPATVSVYNRGVELTAANCPPIGLELPHGAVAGSRSGGADVGQFPARTTTERRHLATRKLQLHFHRRYAAEARKLEPDLHHIARDHQCDDHQPPHSPQQRGLLGALRSQRRRRSGRH